MRVTTPALLLALLAFLHAPAQAQGVSVSNIQSTLGCGTMQISRDADARLAAGVGALTRNEDTARLLLSRVNVPTPENLVSCAMSVSERLCDRTYFEFATAGLAAPNRPGNLFLQAIAAMQEPQNAAGAAVAGVMTGALAKAMGGDFLPWAGAGAAATAFATGFLKSYRDYAVACQGTAESFDARMTQWHDRGRLRPVTDFDQFMRLLQANASGPDDVTVRAMQDAARSWGDLVADNR